MKRRRANRQKLSVSLFPFLAVLICTLGVMIVLLVLAVKSAEVQASSDHQAQQEQADKQIVKLKQLGGQLDDVETKIELISLNRPDALESLSQSREYRGHLEAEIRKLKEKIEVLDEALTRSESSEPAEIDVEKTKLEVEQLTQQILLAEKDLEKKRKEVQANSKVTYSIVPHAGNGGTFRRPIFIEARGASLTLQPFGIELRSDDFVPPLGPGNPLDAAVLAIREYWQKHQVSDTDGNPYPLIVIRPEGSEGYAVARRALVSWEDEFGYELVEGDKSLDFGKVDNELKSVVEAAIAESRLRQQKMLAARPTQPAGSIKQAGFRTGHGGYSRGSTHRSDQRPGLTVSGSGGGFVVNSGWEEMYNRSEGFGGSSLGSGNGRSGTPSAEADFDRLNSGSALAKGEFNSSGMDASSRSPATQNPGQGNSPQRGNSSPTLEGTELGSQHNGQSSPSDGQAGSAASSTSAAGQSASSKTGGQGDAGTQAAGGPQCENCDSSSSPSLMYQHMSVAKTKGRDWAVPNKASGATAYVRPIRIVCTESELEVMSPLGVEKRIPIEGQIEATIDPLVNEIWRQIESWGIPGERSYWKPELRISVVAGGEHNFEKLQGLLFDSGVQVQESER